MIPKIIHYCWFGGKEIPEESKRCILSWKQYCPDYEIKRWDETNFDVSQFPFALEAYRQEKWAFVSDIARFWILYQEGGIYLDTDVELVNPIDSLVQKGQFFACERMYSSQKVQIASGLGMALERKSKIAKTIVDYYKNITFKKRNPTLVGVLVNRMFEEKGFDHTNRIQKIDNITIYPTEYMCPKDYWTGDINITDKTISIHHYSASWLSALDKVIYKLEMYSYKTNFLLSLFIKIIVLFLKVVRKIYQI